MKAQSDAVQQIIEMATPPWPQIHFEVHCGRCGATLNGCESANCPGCDIDLHWPTVLPVDQLCCPDCDYHLLGLREPRCPECGADFDWREVLENARAQRRGTLDSLWRERPLRALGSTLWQSVFCPRTLWSRYPIQATPRLLPVVLLICLQWAVFRWGWAVTSECVTPLMNRLSSDLGRGMRFSYNMRTPSWFFLFMAFWYLMTVASFQVFFQSRRRFRVRWRHFLRVFVHSTVLAAGVPVLWCLAEAAIDSVLLARPSLGPWFSPYQVLDQVAIWLIVFSTWVYLWIAIRHYVRMPRGWGLGALALTLGYLLARMALILTP